MIGPGGEQRVGEVHGVREGEEVCREKRCGGKGEEVCREKRCGGKGEEVCREGRRNVEGREKKCAGKEKRCGGKGEVVWYAKAECAYRPCV